MNVRQGIANVLLVCASTGVALLILEIGLRVHHGELLDFSSELPEVPDRLRLPRAAYDSLLGWVPAVGAHGRAGQESVTAAHLRSNGPEPAATDLRVLTVGDSFTFGDEVEDTATWPAQLGRQVGARVFNAGVFAYGIDQAVLRATVLFDTYRPDWVVLAFIRNDVNRAELSYYSAWKPYYTVEDGDLVLRNVPVPRTGPPTPRFDGLRKAFGYSLLASAISRRLLDRWWYYGSIVRVHDDGVEIAVRLVGRLDRLMEARGARLLVVGLAAGGRIGGNDGMTSILDRMAEEGVPVLNLVPGTEDMIAEGAADLYMPGGHYTPDFNRWVARQVGDYVMSASADAAAAARLP
jgi:hypothetical protein